MPRQISSEGDFIETLNSLSDASNYHPMQLAMLLKVVFDAPDGYWDKLVERVQTFSDAGHLPETERRNFERALRWRERCRRFAPEIFAIREDTQDILCDLGELIEALRDWESGNGRYRIVGGDAFGTFNEEQAAELRIKLLQMAEEVRQGGRKAEVSARPDADLRDGFGRQTQNRSPSPAARFGSQGRSPPKTYIHPPSEIRHRQEAVGTNAPRTQPPRERPTPNMPRQPASERPAPTANTVYIPFGKGSPFDFGDEEPGVSRR